MAKKFFGAVFADGTKITRTSNGWKDFAFAWKAVRDGGSVWTGYSATAANAAKSASYYSAAAEVVPVLTFASAKDLKAWKGGA